MRVSLILNGIEFEWESLKADANLRKHGVSFQNACEVFFDPFLHTVETEVRAKEFRENVIGLTEKWRLLRVTYVLRDPVIRIISARPTTRLETRAYEDQ